MPSVAIKRLGSWSFYLYLWSNVSFFHLLYQPRVLQLKDRDTFSWFVRIHHEANHGLGKELCKAAEEELRCVSKALDLWPEQETLTSVQLLSLPFSQD